MLSSLTGLIKNHIISKLPAGYVKSTYIKNSNASVTDQKLSEEGKMSLDRPMLSLSLNYSYNEPVSFGDNFRWGLTRIPHRAYLYTNIYRAIIVNEADDIYLSTIDERVKLVYEIGLMLDSEHQAYNLLKYLKSHVGVARPYYLNGVDLEIPLPAVCLNLIIRAKGFDISTSDGLHTLHNYLTKWSGGRVTFKKNLSSGNFNYFVKYNANVFCKIPDMPTIERNVEGKSTTSVVLRYNMEVELIDFTNFIAEHVEIDPNAAPVPGIKQNGDSLSYNFTSSMALSRQDGAGRSIAVTMEFLTDLNTAIDTTSFESALQPDMANFIERRVSLLSDDVLAVTSCLNLRILRDGGFLVEGTDYLVDWVNREATLLNPRANYVYKIALYVDMVAYNSFVEALRDKNPNLNRAMPVKDIPVSY